MTKKTLESESLRGSCALVITADSSAYQGDQSAISLHRDRQHVLKQILSNTNKMTNTHPYST